MSQFHSLEQKSVYQLFGVISELLMCTRLAESQRISDVIGHSLVPRTLSFEFESHVHIQLYRSDLCIPLVHLNLLPLAEILFDPNNHQVRLDYFN